MKLIPQQISNYLTAHGANPACPSCYQNDWSFTEEPDQNSNAAILVIPEQGFALPPPHLPIIVMICNRCSFVRMHAKKPIEAWVQNPATGTSAGNGV